MKLGEKIKQLRKSKGISQEELAFMLKINRNYLSRIETGKSEPTSSILKNIAEIFSVDLNSLLESICLIIINNCFLIFYSFFHSSINELIMMIIKIIIGNHKLTKKNKWSNVID